MPTPHTPISWIEIKNYIDTQIEALQAQIDNVAITMPIGHIFPVCSIIPVGCIACDGSTYNRTTYPKLYEWLTEQNIMVSDSSWNSTANSNNGYCTKFSTGNGSTTFRVPNFAPFMELGTEDEREGYHRAGIPNITGYYAPLAWERDGGRPYYGGAIYNSGSRGGVEIPDRSWEGGNYDVSFDASRSNSIYGRSTTVQPESNLWLMVVQAA